MGYLDLNAAYAQTPPLDAFTGHAAARGEVAEFSPLEWTTILMSRRDGLSSLGTPGRFARFLGRLFGIDHKPRLADARLEALRRFAVLSWVHGYNVPKSEFGVFKAAGYSMSQAETLLASVAITRADRGR
ncbi:hypothetical protein HL653_13340 [Sphingomonas sp. AP4-R1]|uniref:hypothetical protein n=1 Tax=Sphingomonas sp. AP4-R1 TaxID=2735134 RepID=UPI0014933CE2|nr:hypothetical protein [Sphingomonas sp. AP4-R1]QJU58616.1 hypothetical protein HL653_13340 [Sphingomonas sp. AP4-R1]